MMRKIWIGLFLLGQLGLAVPAWAADSGRYQVVAAGVDNAYLVDTETGFVWALSYRTLATGREPVAIPYKFILITPKSQHDFLVEQAPVLTDTKKEAK